MSKNEDTQKMGFVSEKDEYLWAFVTLKSGLDIIDNLNSQFLRVNIPDFSDLFDKNPDEFDKALQKYNDKLKVVNEKVKSEGLKQVYVSLEPEDTYEKVFYEIIARNMSRNIIADMSLVYAVALFEDYLQKILRITFNHNPETLKNCQKTVTYEELFDFSDIKKAKEAIIEREILIINEDIEKVREYLLKKFKIDISEFIEWNSFKELFYRRNIIIHNSGKPNQLYRIKTGYTGEDARLFVTRDYLMEALSRFITIATNISVTFQEKFVKADKF